MKALALATLGLVFLSGAAAAPKERLIAYSVEHAVGGTVWRVGLDGSNARELTEGETADVSPDGTLIAFISKSRLYVIGPDGAPIKLLHDFGSTNCCREAPRALWAPDSRRLAVQDSDGPIWLVDTRTGGARKLVRPTRNCCVVLADFAPSGCAVSYVAQGDLRSSPFHVRVIACTSRRGRTVGTTLGEAVWLNAGIAVRTRAGLRLVEPNGHLARVPGATGSPIASSGNGRVLLTENGGSLVVTDVATGRAHVLPRPATSDAQGTLALSNDGSMILALLGCYQDRIPSGTLEAITVETGAATVIVEDHGAQGGPYGPCRASWNA